MTHRKHHRVRCMCSWILLLVFALSLAPALGDGQNMLANGDYSKGSAGWGLYKESGGSADFTQADGKGVLLVKKAGQKDYSVQLYYDGFGLEKGGTYRLAFTVTSTIERSIQARIQRNGGSYEGYAVKDISLPAQKAVHVEMTFSMEMDSDPAPRLCFNVGKPKDGPEYESHTLTFENGSLVLMDGTNIAKDTQMSKESAILINQIGYLPNAAKTAFFREEALGKTFEVISDAGAVVYSGQQSAAIDDLASGDKVASGDFSAVTTPGTYQIRAGEATSEPFVVGEKVYEAVYHDTLRFFTLQRCGIALSEDLAGAFAHSACHTSLATLYGTTEKKDVSGGWHDAGDYGRYVVPAAKTAADLLLAYEENPAMFAPEKGESISAVLKEVRFELDWLLKMQDEKTGGVYHKVTCAAFPGFIMPEKETEPLIISPISTAATGNFAAILALASRIYQESDPAYSQALLTASEKAWAYLEANPDGGTGFHNPQGIQTGEYGDTVDTDERYWAAAELARTTQKEQYAKAAAALKAKNPPSGLGWQTVGTYGDMALLHAGAVVDESVLSTIKSEVQKTADALWALSEKDGYHMTLDQNYPWGSNMTVANNGLYLLLATAFSSDNAQAYTALARQHLDYLMGANPMGYCYITGHGSLSPKNPHHRPSQAAKMAVPGMLAGGPNGALEDPFVKTVLSGKPPAKCYADSDQSYSTNEVAIYWNSPLVYLMALLLK